MRFRALALFVLLFVTACTGSDLQVKSTATPTAQVTPTTAQPAPTTGAAATVEPQATATHETPATPGGTATVAATPSTGASGVPQQLEAEISKIEEQTILVRGLKPKADVLETFISKDQLRQNLIKDISKDYTKEDARQDVSELWLLRLLPDRGLDLFQLQIDLLTEQVAGYYDQDAKKLFVLSSQNELSPLARETLAHEFTHSLQDQYFDLGKLLPKKSEEDDRDTAVRALVEGDATLSGLTYARQFMSAKDVQKLIEESSQSSTAVLDKAPRYIRESLIFPYNEGATFASKLLKTNGFKSIDKALADPPKSTEQILHPEKYLNAPRDEPLPVTVPPLTSTLGTGWERKDGGTVGEFDLKVMLDENGSSNADSAAAGWGGARYEYYAKGESALIYVGTRWDSASDAAEFESAMRQTLVGSTPSGKLFSKGGRFVGFARSGDAVIFVAGTEAEQVEAALAAR